MKCSFCGREIPKGTGKIVVKKDGTVYWFCSLKCEKNLLKLGRKPQNVKWTAEFHKAKAIMQAAAGKKEKMKEKKTKEENSEEKKQ